MNGKWNQFARGSQALGAWLLWGWSCAWAQDPVAILPEWNEDASRIGADVLAPPQGLLPDPGPEGEPTQLPAADALPELPPLTGPSHGEEAPELPDLPGLVAPKHAPVPLNKAGQPAVPDPLANIAEEARWIRSPREARKEAAAKGRPMLLVFAGFGWSPACQALNNDLFANPAFKKFAADNLVLSFLDVPTRSMLSGLGSNDDTKADIKLRRQEAIAAYRSFLKVRSLPTVIMFDADGHEVDRMVGYNINKQMRPLAYIKASDRIANVTKTIQKQEAEKARHRKLLAEVQGYRTWSSRVGTTLFAKYVNLLAMPAPTEEKPEATEPGVTLMDENGVRKTLPLRLLTITDAEIAKRKYEASKPPAWATASSDQELPVRTAEEPTGR